MTNLLALLWRNKVNVILGLLVVVYLLVARLQTDRANAAALRAKEQVFERQAEELGLSKAEVVSVRASWAILTQKNAILAAKLRDAGARPVERITTTVTVRAKDVGTATPTGWKDAEGRFDLDLASGVLSRTQKFGLDLTVIEGPDGRTRFAKQEFTEISPLTGKVIPGEEISLVTNFLLVKEVPVTTAFHQRIVAAFGTAGFGLGSQFWNFRDRFNVAALLLYSPGEKALTAAIQPGWRVKLPFLDTNLSVGPLAGYRLTPNPKWTFGAGVTLELTR